MDHCVIAGLKTSETRVCPWVRQHVLTQKMMFFHFVIFFTTFRWIVKLTCVTIRGNEFYIFTRQLKYLAFWSMTTMILIAPSNERDVYLEGQIVVLLLLTGTQSVPPLPKYLADCPIVLVGVALVHQSTVAFAEDHECIHGTADVVFLPLGEIWEREVYTFSISCRSDIYQFVYFILHECLGWTDLPVSILWQGAQGLSAPLHGASGGCRIICHTWRETEKKKWNCEFIREGK